VDTYSATLHGCCVGLNVDMKNLDHNGAKMCRTSFVVQRLLQCERQQNARLHEQLMEAQAKLASSKAGTAAALEFGEHEAMEE
jgi:hypothetical protein